MSRLNIPTSLVILRCFHNRESAQQGWRLMAIFTCYFGCSEVLKPYLLKYLESTAQSKEQAHNSKCIFQHMQCITSFIVIAQSCLHNLRQTFKYGGRKNVPSRDELQALTVSSSEAVSYFIFNRNVALSMVEAASGKCVCCREEHQ